MTSVKPDLGPGLYERVWEAVNSADKNLDVCHSVIGELRAALTDLLGVQTLLLDFLNWSMFLHCFGGSAYDSHRTFMNGNPYACVYPYVIDF